MAAKIVQNGRNLIEKVTARVFCERTGKGGNPVTIFAPQTSLSINQQESLAKSCDWESVFVNRGGDKRRNKMAFYLPTGEQVSFCAHAAMGGCTMLTTAKHDDKKSENRLQFTTDDVTMCNATLHKDGIVSLDMNSEWTQEAIEHPPILRRILRDHHGLTTSDLVNIPSHDTLEDPQFPTFCNSSVARNKTLVYVNSVDVLHKAKPPVNSEAYRRACDAINSTGLYLYTKHAEDGDEVDTTWKCRQFPRASGYAEDPATGIAAAALAVSLYNAANQQQLQSFPAAMYYRFQQGTAMGKVSMILVENIKLAMTSIVAHENDKPKENKAARRSENERKDDVDYDDGVEEEGKEDVDEEEEEEEPTQWQPPKKQKGTISFTLLGKVEIDVRDMIEVQDEE